MKSIKSKLPDTGTTIFTIMSALANQHGAINLAQGFPNFDCPSSLKQLISKSLQAKHHQYAPMPGLLELRKAIATKVLKLYGFSIDPGSEICITAGATQALFTAIATLINPGDEVVILEPAYDSYIPAIKCFGGIIKSHALRAPDFKMDWSKVESLIGPKTKLIIINNPLNPLGKVFSHEDMLELQRIVLTHDLFLISDEVYEHLVYDGLIHESVLNYPDLYQNSFIVYSFGKSLHATGWKIGYCIAPENLMSEFKKIHQYNVFSVNSFMQYALAEFLEDESEYLSLNSFYQQKRDRLTELLANSRLIEIKSQGSYFQLYDFSAISALDDFSFAKQLTIQNKVAVIPLSPFYSTKAEVQLIRICFAKTDDILEAAAERIILL